MQEPQPDQLVALDSATRHAFAFYPGNSLGYRRRTAVGDVGPRGLEHDLAQLDLDPVHGRLAAPADRAAAAAVHRRPGLLDQRPLLRPAGQPGRPEQGDEDPVAGDHQAQGGPDCRSCSPATSTRSRRRSARSPARPRWWPPPVGSNVGGHCVLPPRARIDWIFGSRGAFSGALMDDSAQVRRTTDHHVLSARFGTG